METLSFLDLFQGIATLVASEPKIMIRAHRPDAARFCADLSRFAQRAPKPL